MIAAACLCRAVAVRQGAEMSNQGGAGEREWPTPCPLRGTELKSAVIDFHPTNQKRAECQPGEMIAIDYCPSCACRGKDSDSQFAGTPQADSPE